MLRLLIDNGNAPARTGTGVYGRGLMDALKKYSSHEVDVEDAGISWTGDTFRPLRRLVYLWRLRRLAAHGFRGAEVVHFINVYVPAGTSQAAIVGTIHDLDAIQHPEVYTRRYSVYYARTVKSTIERADMVLTDTDAVRNMILDRYGMPGEKVTAVGIGLNPRLVGALDSLPSSATPGSPVVLFVGRLEKKKNIAWFVRTAAEGVKRGALPKLTLVLAGSSGYGFDEIEAALKFAGPLVEWVANPTLESLAFAYRKASVVVLPSVCEGFGIPLLEAMYCGKPIVASRIPVSQEVAGNAARFFTPGDKDEFYSALRDALMHGNGEKETSAAQERLRRYSWENLAPQYVAAYKRARS